MVAHLEGHSLGHYRLLSLIGRGGMGEVYLSENEQQADDAPQRKVAIKVVPVSETTLSTDAEALRIFREGRFLVELNHPHILPLYHDGIQDDYLFLVMPYMPDGSLADAIHARSQLRLALPVELERVADYIGQVASALQYTHDRHIVHRDVKPGNVLVEVRPDGRWHLFLADFGIARNVETTSNEEGWRGTVAYMAPEQFRGQMSPAADQYALAVLAFQLLSGQVPFAMSPPAVRTINPAIPEAVEEVLLQGLATRPEERFASVTDFATAFRKAIDVKRETAAEAKRRGDDLFAQNRHEEALAAYEQATTLDPGEATYWLDKGRALGMLKRYKESLANYVQALNLPPKDADAWYNRGNILAILQRYEEALAAFEQASTLDPKYANKINAWYNKGTVLANLKRYDEALAAFERALTLDPKHVAAWSTKGTVLANLKRCDEALAAFEKASTLEPKDANIWNNKGIILSYLQRYEEAAEAYDHVVKLTPTNQLARRNRAMAHLAALASEAEVRDTERLAKEQAVTAANNAVGQNPESAEAWCGFGEALNQLKQHDRANEAFDHAIALDPQRANAWAFKGDALLGLEKCEDAVEAYDRALAIDAERAETWANKAVALFRLMRYEEAATSYDHAIALNPDYGVTSEMPVVKAPVRNQDEGTTAGD